MTVHTCVNCGTAIPAGATFCPECGNPVTTQAKAAELRPPAPSIGDSFKAVQQSKLFAASGSFINLLDDSAFIKKPLLWLHVFFAILNILVPVYFLFLMINNNVMSTMGFGGFLLWVVVAVAGWMGFQLWWNRKDKIDRYYQSGDEFFAIPLFSHLIQTIGEWVGIMMFIIGTGAAVVLWVFSSGDRAGGLPFPIPMQQFGIGGMIAAPVLGFVIVLFSKVLAELYRALASIANNTKAMAGRN